MTLHETLDVALEVVRQGVLGVRAVDNALAGLGVELGLGPKLAPEVLQGVAGGAGQAKGECSPVEKGCDRGAAEAGRRRA